MSAPRDQFAEVGRSARAVMDAACTADPALSAAEWRVLTAVLRETVTWSRHTDALVVARISELSGIASERLVRTTLGSLRDRGLVIYAARRGRPRAGQRGCSTIGIPDVNTLLLVDPAPPAEPAATPVENRHPGVPVSPVGEGEVKPAPRGAGYSAKNRHPGVPIPEKYSREEELLPPDPPLTQAAIMVGVPSSSGSSDHDQTTGPGDDVDAVLDALAGTLPVSTGDRAALAGPLRTALDTDGWDPDTLAGHLLAELPAVIRTRGLMTHRLSRLSPSVLPDGPAVCSCSACRRHVTRLEVEIRRQAAAADRARHRAATTIDDTATRNQRLTDALGTELHGRIVTAEIARSPIYQRARRSPATIRAVVTAIYADHDHDIDRIRAHALTLPPGPSESAQDDTTGPTADGDVPVRLRRVEGA